MFPFMESTTDDAVVVEEEYKEFGYDFKNDRMTGTIVTRKDALKVWVYHTLKTHRYTYSIYDWDYGEDVTDLIGQGYEKGYINSEVERRIKEALMINEKIQRVYDFDISFNEGLLTGKFKIDSIYGEVDIDV